MSAHSRLLTFPLLVAVFVAFTAVMPLPGQAGENEHFRHVHFDDRGQPVFSYALFLEQGGSIFIGNSRQLKAAMRAGTGTYLWAQQGEQRFVIDDPAIIREVETHWASLAEPERELNQLEKQMEAFTSVMEIHQAEFETIRRVEGFPDPETMREFEQEMAAFGKKMGPLGKQMGQIGERIAKLGEQADKKTRQSIKSAIQSGKAMRLTD